MANPLVTSKNPLLARDDVGKAKPTSYDIPHEDFTYGCPDNPDFEGAREVMMQWVTHVPSPRAGGKVQDFQKLNKVAITDKALSARAVAKHRQANSIPLSTRSDGVLSQPKVYPHDVMPTFSYGKQTRVSTPIASVVSYSFASQYEQDISSQYATYKAEKEQDSQVRKIRLTKAAHGHASPSKAASQQGEEKEMFKISKFKKVPCKVEFPKLGASLIRLPDEPESSASAAE
eukprot:gnl/MRDRNA2_/MRDRNA2_93968_c0_seq1.p1 gnl/MRDRNA2_/MRDRNA2_93968_c0~~gnl/MRDRNA2_/MRDRNA2_93968_c0_seq1.p1  ORF type:complete len:254 (+),score=37.99 gnl/MRDRNA2_/MRDRNA2_93968_c0_seq1:71-763(+)